MTYNPQQDVIANKDNKLVIQTGDQLIAAVANSTIAPDRMRVNITMRQDGLGLLKWLVKEKVKKKTEAKEEKEPKAGKKEK